MGKRIQWILGISPQLTSLKVCPHLLPKTATLYPETADFITLYPETGDFVAENGALSPFLATKSPISGDKVAVFGNKCGQAISLLKPTTFPCYAAEFTNFSTGVKNDK